MHYVLHDTYTSVGGGQLDNSIRNGPARPVTQRIRMTANFRIYPQHTQQTKRREALTVGLLANDLRRDVGRRPALVRQ
jgi:hypothetical protein